jgi:tetratricopeptide (TPR) repeat protein
MRIHSLLVFPFLFVVAALCQPGAQADPPQLAAHRCAQVQLLVRMLESVKQTPDPDTQAASYACSQETAALKVHDLAKARQVRADAAAALDRLHLTFQSLFNRLDKAAASVTGIQRFYALADLAKDAFNAGQPEKAQSYARELLQLAPEHRDDWNYGNAIYYGYFVLGRIALQQGNLKLAGQYLLDAASTPGSPQLDSFGPNVTLAKELLEKGQSSIVLQYLAQCRDFWKLGHDRIDSWTAAIRSGAPPDFTPNLNY